MTDLTKHDGKRKLVRDPNWYSVSKNKLRKRASRAIAKATRRARKRLGLAQIQEQLEDGAGPAQ